MSLTFISNITNDSNQEEIDKQCSIVWNSKKETAIKLFFFILDKDKGKNQPKAFIKIMKWLYKNHHCTFMKNFSLIVGRYNSETLKMVDSQKMLSEEWEKYNTIINYFIDKNFQDSFNKNWNNDTRIDLINAYVIPEYGSWETFIELTDTLNDRKLFYVAINIITNKIREDIKQGKHSNVIKIIDKYPKYYSAIEDYETLKKKNENMKPKVSKEGKYLNFKERYAFISV